LSDRDAFSHNSYSDAGRVRLMHHDARWRQEFEQTRSGLLQGCQGRVVAVEHIGSTAIGGVIAQPIIDAVAVIADPVDFRDAVLLTEGLNYRTAAPPEWAEDGRRQQLVLNKPRYSETTHRVYFVTQGSPLLQRAIQFRDHLRGNPAMAIEFEAAKVDVWRQVEGDASGYEAGMVEVFEHFQPA
tara:strand:+ start:457 stop:1008 length:552 start_codon:yes stop_codon:yes gene_type:complete